jgi:hypothetical protein
MSLQHQNRDHTFPFLAPAGVARPDQHCASQCRGEGRGVVTPVGEVGGGDAGRGVATQGDQSWRQEWPDLSSCVRWGA